MLSYPNGDTTRIPDGPCQFCGAYPAPLHRRPPGPMRDLPADLRGKYIRHCEAEECRAKADGHVARRGFEVGRKGGQAA